MKFVDFINESNEMLFSIWPDSKNVLNVPPSGDQVLGILSILARIFLLRLSMKMFAYEGAIRVPMAVPFVCTKCSLLKE